MISRMFFNSIRKALALAIISVIFAVFFIERYIKKYNTSMLITIISDDRTYESLDGMPLVTNLNFTKNTSSADIEILMTNNPDLKLILTWRTLDSQPFYRHLWMSNCLDYPCIITDKRDLLNHSTAVVFHGIDWGDTPNYRSPEQKYVFNMWESPYHTHADLNNLAQQNFFNLTMTYRLDSDIYSPYGRFYKLNKPVPEREIMSAVSGKTRLAAQFVTNCNTPSKREQLVAELQKFISVDVYGSCGPLKCERKIQNECNSKLESTYYFYLAFENSICLDYVTEKFFSRVEVAVVPVVLLRSNYEAIAPKKSFIAVSDFLSVKSLADYLVYLSKNHTAYGEYLSWRQHYTTKQSSLLHTDKSHGFCGLCKALHDPRVISRNKVYPDMKQFWKNMANCNTDIVDTLLSDSKLPH